jgi:predicted metalloendopeptidase
VIAKTVFGSLLFALPVLAQAQSVDVSAMDKKADPCVDFYQYACGGWIASHPLPADRSRFGRFAELQDRNEKVELEILRAASAPSANRSPIEQKIGDHFASCMDTAAINKRGLAPLKAELDRIEAIADGDDVAAEVARLHRAGVSALFSFGARSDPKDSDRTIAGLSQGGLSLPDRDYYLKEDAKSVEIRRRFEQHVANMFQLAGDPAERASAKARMVVEIETIMAKAFMDRVSQRDPNKTYNMIARTELAGLAQFAWDDYFAGVGAPRFDTLNVAQPETFKALGASLPNQPLDSIKAYFAYHFLRDYAFQSPEAIENEYFDFYQRILSGVQQPRPREYRCAAAVDSELGDLLGQKYIEAAFGADAKARITELVDGVEKALGKDIDSLPWMSDPTKKAALLKLKAITNNVGYPKKWRDYSAVTVARDDFAGNTRRATEAMYAQRIQKIGMPTDKNEWSMTTPTVNAFYSPAFNSINFPAGILQPPFFDPKRDMAVNYGGIGAVIGHEMTHGFDDQGRKYDAAGNLRDWWTPADGAEFEKRASCVDKQYSAFTWKDNVTIDGKLTLGESTADGGGVGVAYMALQEALKGKSGLVDGFTPEQRFFLGFAQVWCENVSAQEARKRAMTDPHAPGRFRVTGTFQNMPEFQKAFSCKAGQPMVSPNMCRVW